MKLIICNRVFSSEDIQYISIREREIFIEMKEDFVRLKYSSETDIRDARLFNRLQKLTHQDVYDALQILITVCEYNLSTKDQCKNCPLYKSEKCIITTIPINWR